MDMKLKLSLEEAVMLGGSVVVFSLLPYAWWWFPVLLLVPDLSMAGYLVNVRVGAATYNLFHHKGVAVIVFLTGWMWGISIFQLAGTILFGHASMDRMLGLGLKYPDHFQHTHLGWLNDKRKSL